MSYVPFAEAFSELVWNEDRNIRTTQIYAKIVDEQKRKAVNLIPKL